MGENPNGLGQKKKIFPPSVFGIEGGGIGLSDKCVDKVL